MSVYDGLLAMNEIHAAQSQSFTWTPDPASGITQRFIEANGQNFELAECGSGDRLALMLHGFPELNYSERCESRPRAWEDETALGVRNAG